MDETLGEVDGKGVLGVEEELGALLSPAPPPAPVDVFFRLRL